MLARTAAGAALLLSAASTLHAQAASDTLAQRDTVLTLTAVQVRALLPDVVTASPGAATVLTVEQVARLRPYTLHDALDVVPGVRTIDDDVLGRRSGIGIRGAPPRRSRKSLLMEDGVPINGSAYLDPSAHYTPPLERVERTEVLRGAGQIVHGPLNNYGIVNFRTRRASVTPATVLELGGGSSATFRRHAPHTRTIGRAGIVLAYTGVNADGTFDVERHRYDDAFASTTLRLSDATSVHATLTWFQERSRGYDEGNLTPAQFALHPRSKLVLGESREYNNMFVEYRRATVSLDTRAGERVRISAHAFGSEVDRPRFQTRGTAPADGGVMEGRGRVYRMLGAEARTEVDMPAQAAQHTLQAGLRAEAHAFSDARPVGRPGEGLSWRSRGSARAVAGHDGYTRSGRLVEYRAPALSFFVQDIIRSGAWTVTPGVRFETYEQERRVVHWPGSEEEGTTRAERNTLVLPGVSALYDVNAVTQLYAGVHRGFAPATARTEEFPLIPETGINTQVGVRTMMLQVASMEVAAFHNRIADTLIRENVDVFGDGLFVNSADADVYGVDVSLRIAPKGTLHRAGMFADVAWNVTRARFRTAPLTGRDVPEVPRQAGSITAGSERVGAWHASATLSHFGSFYADIHNSREMTTDGGRVPGRTLLGARLSRTLPQYHGVSVWVQGRNLADRLYVSDVQDGLRPGAPRTVTAGATVRF